MGDEPRMLNALVVEDEAIAAMAISHMIEDLGCRVVDVASRGEDCLEIAARTPLDFVVMDIRLKGKMSGLDAATELLRRYDVPIVFTSAYSTKELEDRTDLGSNNVHFISKPVTEAALQRIIERLREARLRPRPDSR